ncbi:hypothetical protein DICPUDRAFT_152401 [Dictyostelium purpureum]|uniref:Transmembrane protein n=1 Tax=Dictyostelium purpureum TaxID=5786 RepID=F0ZL93_DICPU|nr:uncharacterized protein DICPUDRAFT_152401 [Dictyostelium purpureum]EGC35261.1 hypothetical protein DICPUDRAFT_152401 [Dictyostelium purpureum]|eukprot:XP_003288187.1 hypothetical protein DICPUDRAFT_152401 [Dictyostelium purpureum]
MKLLLFLFLLLVSFTGAKSESCYTNGQKIEGFTTEFITSSFNINFKTDDQIKQLSFYTAGLASMDYVNSRFFGQYRLNEGGDDWVSGQLYAFKENSTQYFLDSLVNGTCYISKLVDEYLVESFPQVEKVSQGTMGNVDVDFLQIIPSQTSNSTTTNTIIINRDTCGLMSMNSHNNINNPTGFALTTFYNFINQSDQTLFNLPPQCYGISSKYGKTQSIFDYQKKIVYQPIYISGREKVENRNSIYYSEIFKNLFFGQ